MIDIEQLFAEELESVADGAMVIEEGGNTFVIDTDVKAEWAMKKIAAERAELARLTATIDDAVKYYVDKRNELVDRFERRTGNLKYMLQMFFEQYARESAKKTTKTQVSYSLPSGKIRRKHVAPKIERDDAALTDWMMLNDASEYVDIVYKPRWGDFKKTLTAAGDCYVNAEGEVIPGIKLIPQDDVFDVEVTE